MSTIRRRYILRKGLEHRAGMYVYKTFGLNGLELGALFSLMSYFEAKQTSIATERQLVHWLGVGPTVRGKYSGYLSGCCRVGVIEVGENKRGTKSLLITALGVSVVDLYMQELERLECIAINNKL